MNRRCKRRKKLLQGKSERRNDEPLPVYVLLPAQKNEPLKSVTNGQSESQLDKNYTCCVATCAMRHGTHAVVTADASDKLGANWKQKLIVAVVATCATRHGTPTGLTAGAPAAGHMQLCCGRCM